MLKQDFRISNFTMRNYPPEHSLQLADFAPMTALISGRAFKSGQFPCPKRTVCITAPAALLNQSRYLSVVALRHTL
jgi:hypothetical protein